MEELFTFNQNQIEKRIKRPISTEQKAHFRKRIIHSKISKKQQQPHAIFDIRPSSNNIDRTPKKKVRFNLQNNSVFQSKNIQSVQPIAKKSYSLHQNHIIDNNDLMNHKLNLNRHPFKEINNKNKGNGDLGKKSLSIAENKNKLIKIKQDEKDSKCREKRILSLKTNPKVVPVSQRKLPNAFKNNYVVNINQLKLEMPKKQLQEILKQQKQYQYTKSSSQNLTKIKGISRLQKNLQIQQKFFDKLHLPSKPS